MRDRSPIVRRMNPAAVFTKPAEAGYPRRGFVGAAAGFIRLAPWLALSALLASPALAAPARTPKVIAAVRMRFTSSTAPAVGDVDGDGRPEVAATSDNIGDRTRDLSDPANVNSVTLFGWKDGALRPEPGWPQKTRDATLGLALADLDGDGRDDVLAACGQEFAPDLMQEAGLWLTARLYVFHADGSPVPPWFPSSENTVEGILFGHAYAAPVAADLNGDGHPEILHASQGVWGKSGFEHGGLRVWTRTGGVYAQTQDTDPKLPWYVHTGFAMDTPPVVADLNGDGKPDVIAPTFAGQVYAWDHAGKALPGWFPNKGAQTQTKKGALLRGTIAAADLNGDGKDEVLAGGYDGALYCWRADGKRLFRSVLPSPSGPPPALTSGIAVGRLRRNNAPERDIVAGDMAGGVTAWRPNGQILWQAHTTPGMPVMAEPAIGDVNADGTQDVVVGGTDGYVYAFDGETGLKLWQVRTFFAPTLEGMRLESVFGTPALCDLTGNGHLHIVVASAGRYIADVPSHTWKGFGHVMVLDCGPDTYNKDRLDWPQYRQNAQRTGQALRSPRPS